MYCIILPRAWGKMIQLTTHFEWFVSSTNVTLCLYFFLSSWSQYLTVHYTFKSNKIYRVIKAGKIFQKSGSFCPVSPTLYVMCPMHLQSLSNSYTMGCPPVRGDNPRALASGLSYVQVDKRGITILYHLHQCRPCRSRAILC